MPRLLSIVLLCVVAMCTAAAPASAAWKDDELGFLRKMNDERASRGLSELRKDSDVRRAARVHTCEMSNVNRLHHTPAHKLRERLPSGWETLGENVGVGGTVDSLHGAFMDSPEHKANILHGGFNRVGISTRKKGGRLWVTVIFSRGNADDAVRWDQCSTINPDY